MQGLNQKKILVMMSTYNGEKYVADQIESIMNQKVNANIALRIRDDGSRDATCSIVEAMQVKYSQGIELIKGDNKGYNAGFFELIDMAAGYDYYAFSDQDDIWLEDKLQTAISYIERENGDIPLLYASTSYLVDDTLIPYGTTRKKEKEFTIYNTLIQNICPGHTQVMNNKLLELLKKEIDVSRIYVYDSWITNTAMLYGKILFDNNPHTYYRQHKGNQLGSAKSKIGKIVMSARRVNNGDGIKYRKQIEYFAEHNKDELVKKELYSGIYEFINSKSVSKRIRYAMGGRLYRQRKIETIAFYLSVILKRF